jgi:hypothetical protein
MGRAGASTTCDRVDRTRSETPTADPSAHAPGVPLTAYVVRDSSNLWQRHAIRSKFYSTSDRPQEIYVLLLPAQDLHEPDLLLYWFTNPLQGKVLSGKAQLLGAFPAGKAFLLPLDENRAGHLALFSPAHQAVIDTARVEKLP